MNTQEKLQETFDNLWANPATPHKLRDDKILRRLFYIMYLTGITKAVTLIIANETDSFGILCAALNMDGKKDKE